MRFGPKNRMDRYFEGFSKQAYYDSNGNERFKYVYTGDYYIPEISRNAFIVRKIINIVLFLIAAAVQVWAGINTQISLNRVQYMGFAQCLDILAMIVVAVYIVTHIGAHYRMQVREYKNAHEKFRIAALIAWLVMVCVFICAIVCAIMYSLELNAVGIMWLASYFIAFVCIFVIWLLEFRTNYKKDFKE